MVFRHSTIALCIYLREYVILVFYRNCTHFGYEKKKLSQISLLFNILFPRWFFVSPSRNITSVVVQTSMEETLSFFMKLFWAIQGEGTQKYWCIPKSEWPKIQEKLAKTFFGHEYYRAHFLTIYHLSNIIEVEKWHTWLF